MNFLALERIGKPGSVVTINASVEESTIGERMVQEKLDAGGSCTTTSSSEATWGRRPPATWL